MDTYRVAEMRLSAQCLVNVVSVVAVTLNIVGRHLASDAEYKNTLKESVVVLLKGLRERYTNVPTILCNEINPTCDIILRKS